MWLMVEQAQRVHFRGIKDDAVKMWGVLEGVHMQKQPGTHFNAYDDLFSIRKREEDCICNLRSIGFTLDKLDDELASMTLIRALLDDYNSFVSSLLLKDDLDKITVQNAFVHEDNQHRHHQNESPAVESALVASPSSSTNCRFCDYSGHTQDVCRQYAGAKDQFLMNRNTRGKNKPSNTNSQPQNTASVSQVTEFAGNASALSTFSSLTPPNSNWLADTGATSHMTPHRHWVRNYSPFTCLSA